MKQITQFPVNFFSHFFNSQKNSFESLNEINGLKNYWNAGTNCACLRIPKAEGNITI